MTQKILKDCHLEEELDVLLRKMPGLGRDYSLFIGLADDDSDARKFARRELGIRYEGGRRAFSAVNPAKKENGKPVAGIVFVESNWRRPFLTRPILKAHVGHEGAHISWDLKDLGEGNNFVAEYAADCRAIKSGYASEIFNMYSTLLAENAKALRWNPVVNGSFNMLELLEVYPGCAALLNSHIVPEKKLHELERKLLIYKSALPRDIQRLHHKLLNPDFYVADKPQPRLEVVAIGRSYSK